MKQKFCRLRLGALCALALMLSPAPSTPAQTSPDLAKLFETKPITIVVGSAPGGGYDVFARIVARFVGKYLPGNPSFVIQNIPGGGQLRGLRAAMRSAPDGLTLGVLHPRFVQRELAGIDVPDFDLKKVRVLGSPSAITVPRIWCVRRSVATSWDDLEKLGRPVTNGDTGPGASFGLGPQFVSLIGGPVKMVYGYGGTSEIMAAFDRGETDSIDRCTEEHVPRLFPKWIDSKILAPIFWWEREPSKDWLGKLGVIKVPYIFDVVKAEREQRSAFELAVRFNTFSRTFVAPPGVPDNVYATWKKAFEATTKDPGFIKAAEAAGLEVGLGTADDFNELVDSFSKLSPAGVKILKDLVGQAS